MVPPDDRISSVIRDKRVSAFSRAYGKWRTSVGFIAREPANVRRAGREGTRVDFYYGMPRGQGIAALWRSHVNLSRG